QRLSGAAVPAAVTQARRRHHAGHTAVLRCAGWPAGAGAAQPSRPPRACDSTSQSLLVRVCFHTPGGKTRTRLISEERIGGAWGQESIDTAQVPSVRRPTSRWSPVVRDRGRRVPRWTRTSRACPQQLTRFVRAVRSGIAGSGVVALPLS